MGRVLLLCVLLFSCEVSRDLRPELFACDAGGTCPGDGDSGVPIVPCPLTETCRCMEGKTCHFNCGTSCDVQCYDGSNCEIDCGFGDCSTICEAGATCQVNGQTGTCDTICDTNTSCSIDCNPILSTCTCTGPNCPF